MINPLKNMEQEHRLKNKEQGYRLKNKEQRFKKLDLKSAILVLCSLFILSCGTKQKADMLVFNATIYTVDSSFSTAEAMVIRDGKILETGRLSELDDKYEFSERLDAAGKFIYPGFIDAHSHFMNYGYFLQRVILVNTTSWEDVLNKTVEFSKLKTDGWLLGRGWDQNDWENKNYPTNEELTKLFPDRPVLLTRIDGHAAIANEKALELAGIQVGDSVAGGEIMVMEGQLTGLLMDYAIDLVTTKIPAPDSIQLRSILQEAEKNCFASGLTTLSDCGDDFNLGYKAAEYLQKYQNDGDIKMRVYLMLPDFPENYSYLEKKGIIKTDRLTVRGFKVYGDGALGSRGACLLKPYNDMPGHSGLMLVTKEHFDSVANWVYQKGFQLCTHAIGDSAGRHILTTYGKYLKDNNDRRWRIEHAQVVSPDDFNLFGLFGIVPSVQPTHATSDMYWAEQRLGPERVKGAYAYKQLLMQNGWIALGTDFPVEDISPIKTFYAAVFRKDAKGWPAEGYQMENALSRDEAIKGMTIWAARANFEENEKGSLEKGKWADFVVLDTDLMKATPDKILTARVNKTFIGGEKVFEAK